MAIESKLPRTYVENLQEELLAQKIDDLENLAAGIDEETATVIRLHFLTPPEFQHPGDLVTVIRVNRFDQKKLVRETVKLRDSRSKLLPVKPKSRLKR